MYDKNQCKNTNNLRKQKTRASSMKLPENLNSL